MSVEAQRMQDDYFKNRLEQQKCEFFSDLLNRNPKSKIKNPDRRRHEE